MRWLIALAVLAMVPAAQAVAWEDARGDQELGRGVAEGPGAPERHWVRTDDGGWYRPADVIQASIEETESHLVFEVEVQSLQANEPPPTMPEFEEWRYQWSFTYHGEQLVAGFEQWGDATVFTMYKVLEREFGLLHLYRLFAMAQEREDVPGYRALVPKWMWRDSDSVPMREGDRLEGLRFAAGDARYFHWDFPPCPHTDPTRPQGPFVFDCGWRVRDLMQDGADLGTFEATMSPPGLGHLFVRIEDPIRQSNGLATTYLFEAKVHNLEPEPDDFLLQVSGAPAGWQVHHPPGVRFDDAGAKVVPIAVTVPFVHQHGQENFMELTVLSSRDSSVALSAHFGVVFADPPQPAGHHDTLFFHADDGGWWGWMNTLEEDPEGVKQPVLSWDQDYDVDGSTTRWEIELNPSLDIGLDFDTARPVQLRFDLEFPHDFEGRVDATLATRDWIDEDMLVLARGAADSVTLPGGTPTELQIPLAVEPQADRVPPRGRHNLVLFVNATGTTLPAVFGWMEDGPKLHTDGASLRLPLLDYHDAVDLTGLDPAAFRLEALNGTMREVNPGRTSVVAFNVTNLLDDRVSLDWELRGPERYVGWAHVATPATHLRPGGDGTVVVAFAPPAEADPDEVADLVLIGSARQDPDLLVFGRMTFYIDDDSDIPDQSGELDRLSKDARIQNQRNQKDSPVPVVAGLAALAVALALRRR